MGLEANACTQTLFLDPGSLSRRLKFCLLNSTLTVLSRKRYECKIKLTLFAECQREFFFFGGVGHKARLVFLCVIAFLVHLILWKCAFILGDVVESKEEQTYNWFPRNPGKIGHLVGLQGDRESPDGKSPSRGIFGNVCIHFLLMV